LRRSSLLHSRNTPVRDSTRSVMLAGLQLSRRHWSTTSESPISSARRNQIIPAFAHCHRLSSREVPCASHNLKTFTAVKTNLDIPAPSAAHSVGWTCTVAVAGSQMR
jgi:hypothetical protein